MCDTQHIDIRIINNTNKVIAYEVKTGSISQCSSCIGNDLFDIVSPASPDNSALISFTSCNTLYNITIYNGQNIFGPVLLSGQYDFKNGFHPVTCFIVSTSDDGSITVTPSYGCMLKGESPISNSISKHIPIHKCYPVVYQFCIIKYKRHKKCMKHKRCKH